MRIAIINRTCDKIGGAEVYLDTVISALHSLGHKLAFLHEVDASANHEQISLPQAAVRWTVSQIGRRKAIEALRHWCPDVIYVHALADLALETESLHVAPAVLFAHDYVGTCISGSKTFKFPLPIPCHRSFGWKCLLHYYPHHCGGMNPVTMSRLYRLQSERLKLMRMYAAIVTASDHMRDEYLKHGFPPELVHNVHYFLPMQFGTQPRDTEPKAVTKHGWRLLFVGRMYPLKGALTLLEALPRIVRAITLPIRMTFVGSGPAQGAWQTAARRVQTKEKLLNVDFTGWLNSTELTTLLDDSDLLVVPSLWPEPFGRVGFEAGLRGVPAAGFAVGGIPEWLFDGINGYLAPGNPPTADGLADAVIRCLRDPAEHARLRRGAMEIASRFTLANHMVKLSKVFHAVTNSSAAIPRSFTAAAFPSRGA